MELGNTDNAKRHESLEACVKMIMDHTDGETNFFNCFVPKLKIVSKKENYKYAIGTNK